MTKNVINIADYWVSDKGNGRARVSKYRTLGKVAAELAAVQALPHDVDAKPFSVDTPFEWTMLQGVDRPLWRYSKHDLEVQDLCGAAWFAWMSAGDIQRGTLAQKRAAPLWRAKLNAFRNLEQAAIKAAIDTKASTVDGLMAKMKTANWLREGANLPRRRLLDALFDSATWDYHELNRRQRLAQGA